jgi:putative tryptophan/tyrosine transport system substrate-binding protein
MGFVQLGGLVTYGPSVYEGWREAAIFVDKILRGEKTPQYADPTVDQVRASEQPQDCQGAGSHDPPSLLGRADEVIE